jgi:class 3 adenylate cyclase
MLFADVVHSMDIASAIGAERLREIMAELVNRCAVVVKRYGGTVDKFTGDGIMAVFGAPVALEDHAFRACLGALGIQEETARLAGEVKDRDGIDLRLRVGLNSGQVIAGEIGSRSLGYTTIGEQVGLAQRMESVAPPGGVMLSASTARLVELFTEYLRYSFPGRLDGLVFPSAQGRGRNYVIFYGPEFCAGPNDVGEYTRLVLNPDTIKKYRVTTVIKSGDNQ